MAVAASVCVSVGKSFQISWKIWASVLLDSLWIESTGTETMNQAIVGGQLGQNRRAIDGNQLVCMANNSVVFGDVS